MLNFDSWNGGFVKEADKGDSSKGRQASAAHLLRVQQCQRGRMETTFHGRGMAGAGADTIHKSALKIWDLWHFFRVRCHRQQV